MVEKQQRDGRRGTKEKRRKITNMSSQNQKHTSNISRGEHSRIHPAPGLVAAGQDGSPGGRTLSAVNTCTRAARSSGTRTISPCPALLPADLEGLHTGLAV